MAVFTVVKVKVEVNRAYVVYPLIPVEREHDEEYITDEAKKMIMEFGDKALIETDETNMIRRTDIDIIDISEVQI